MNNNDINRKLWGLAVIFCFGLIGYSAFTAQATDAPKTGEVESMAKKGCKARWIIGNNTTDWIDLGEVGGLFVSKRNACKKLAAKNCDLAQVKQLVRDNVPESQACPGGINVDFDIEVDGKKLSKDGSCTVTPACPYGGSPTSNCLNDCPGPITLTLNASTPNVFTGDFPAGALAAPRAVLNDAGTNKHFLYTFQWESEHKYCQIIRAVLTVKMKANQRGTASGSDAGNDGISVVHMGVSVPPYSEKVYTSTPFPAGAPATKTWSITGAALDNINANHRLSFGLQDDTSVVSATLELWGCCLTLP